MDFIEYMNTWVKSEVLQGRIMIGIGILLLTAIFFIFRSQNELLRGALIPLRLLVLILIGYGGFILYSRPAHAQQSIAQFEKEKANAIAQEKEKHINDNKAGKMLMRYVYPGLILLSALCLLFISAPYYRGLAIGFILVFASTYIIDNGFVTRSDAFLAYLNTL